jgi:acyl-CoA synthetase (AMP-forming)/AMP-acid ligase II
MVGATCYPQSVFDPPSVLDRIEQERITVFAGAPTMIAGVLDLVATTTRDISSLRYSFVGAASVPEELVRRMYRELTLEAVGVGYGLTEATAIVSNTHYDDEPDVVASSCGRAIEGIDVAIFDGEGIELPIGEVGEVVVRGFNVMRGYYDDPEATQAVIDEQGWLHTGDVGVLDHRGNLHITDRIKDMYIVGGFNAYPAEIESILLRDDRLAQVAVIGVPDERLGEVGAAFVVPRPGACVKPDDVVQFARERMANFKAPRYVEVVDALPVNATGKVLKGDLRHRFTHER